MHPNDPVNRFMSEPVVSIGPRASVADALRILMTHSIHHLPVVIDNRVIGLVSSADITRWHLAAYATVQADPALGKSAQIHEVMSSPTIRIMQHESVQRAAEIMARNGVHSLPVVDRDDELVGMLTTTDLMHCCLHPSPATADDADNAKSYPLAEARVAAALSSARGALTENRDPDGIAATLLSMSRRLTSLQEVATAAKRYLNAGQDERLHAALLSALQRLDRLDESLRQAAATPLP